MLAGIMAAHFERAVITSLHWRKPSSRAQTDPTEPRRELVSLDPASPESFDRGLE